MATSVEAPNTHKAARRVFISYARKDGLSMAHRLRDVLNSAGCEVWLDTSRIPGGVSWSKAIEHALDACDVLIAVLTESSYISEICRAEQMWALREGKQVIPVLASPDVPRPLFLSTLDYRKLPDQENELLTDLDTPLPPTHSDALPRLRYDTIPPLPQHFIPREQAIIDLRNLLFSEGEQTNIAVTAVAGMGAIGKTVLAAALCRDPAVQRAFPDGIAWITIGSEWEGDFVPRMREVAKALGDDLSAYDTAVACENRYRNMLHEKAALVVVDDVWSIDHLKVLLVDSPRSRFLFTTRDAGIAKNITDRKYSADLLHPDEACKLLARAVNKKLEDLPPEADRIILECGRLAGAISQIGGSLRGLTLPEWRDTLEALENADISAIEEQLPPGQQSFFKSLAVSVQAIPPQFQERYRKLAILLEDMSAPTVMLQTLWGTGEAETRRTARYLVERSLATWDSGDDPSRGIKLHDLQVDYLRALYPQRKAINLIHGAIRLSAHVIQHDPLQFASQLTGRLLPHRNSPGISTFLDEVAHGAPKPWLRPLHPALHPPGTGLLRTLEGHSGFVYAVAIAPDNIRAISASEDQTLKVWDIETGRMLRTLKGHSSGVFGVAVTPDGKRCISASDDNTLKLWDIETGRVLHTFEGHSASVIDVAVTADGKWAISASNDFTLKVWDLESGCALRTLEGHSAPAHGIAVMADGKRAVSASRDATLKVWDLESGRTLRTLTGHSGSVLSVAICADNQQAVSASTDCSLKVWNIESGRLLRTLDGHSGSVVDVAVTADGKRAVSASSDGTLKVWDLESGRLLHSLEGHPDSVNGVAVAGNGKFALSASDDGTIKIWDLQNDRRLSAFEGHLGPVLSVALNGAVKLAVSGSRDNTSKVWDVESGRVLRTLEGHSDSVCSVALSPDGSRVLSGSADKTLKLWDIESGHAVRTLEGHTDSVDGVAIMADGTRAVSASSDKTLMVWNLNTGHLMGTPKGHFDAVYSVAIPRHGTWAISSSRDKTLKVWDLESGRALRTLKGHSDWVRSIAITANGKQAVSVSDDLTMKVWDLETGRLLRTFKEHSDFVNSVAITADGRRAISASSDKTLKAFDLEGGRCIATFYCDAGVNCCAMDEQIIAAGDDSGRVYFLRLEE